MLILAAGLTAAVPARSQTYGGVLKVALDTDPNCLDPQQAGNNNSLNISRQITDSLTDQNPDTGEIVPWLATSWSVSADSRRFTFFLRPGVTFSDGTPVDAAAVKANLERIISLGARATLGSSYLAGVQSIATPDHDTVVVTFAQPSAQFLQASSTMSLGLLSLETVKKSADERCQGQLVGTGPFTIVSFVHNQLTRIARRDDYNWPSVLAGHGGKAYLEGIDYYVIAESGVRVGSLLSGQIDVDAVVLPQDEPVLRARNLPLLVRTNPGVVSGFYPNEANPILKSQAVRQALNKAINRAELQSIIGPGRPPASAVLARTTPLYGDLSQELAYDPQGARQLLDAAGWSVGGDGIRTRDGQRLTLKVDYSNVIPSLELVQQQLRAVGIELRLNRVSIAQAMAVLESPEYVLRYGNLTRADPDILRTVFHVKGRNLANRPPGEVDDLLARLSATLDPDLRRQLVEQASLLLLREGHSIPISEYTSVLATGRRVRGLHFEASTRLQFYDTSLQQAPAP